MAGSYDGLTPPIDPEGESLLRTLRGQLDRLVTRHTSRDTRMQNVLAVRQGRMRDVFPDLFPEGPFDRGIVANMVDVAARDLAEVLAPLPSFNCASAKTASDTAQKFAEKRTKIANHYIEFSNLQTQMYNAADRYFTYGFVPAIVEIDLEANEPRIVFLDSIGAYPVYNRWGEVSAGFFVFYRTKDELIAEYPFSAGALASIGKGNTEIRVVRYHDAKRDLLFIPDAGHGLILEQAANVVGECLLEWVKRPGLDNDTHGQFDDVLAVQVAKARFALLSLEAAQKAVQAPIAMPNDVQELAFGPDSIMRSAQPERIRRVDINIPSSAFATQQVLDQELRQGSRYPNARNGEIDGSVVTGRGVQALMSGFDTQVRTGQSMFARALTSLVRKAYIIDERVFGSMTKTVRGNSAGTPYEINYTPSKDIKGDYTVDVQYGLMAGLDPNRALVFGLQARGDNLISREFMQENMPFALNPSEEQQRIDIEDMRDALKQAVAGYAQAIPVLAQAGQDPGEILSRLAQIILGRQKGRPIEDVISQAFEPPEPPEQPGVEGIPGEDAMGAPGQTPPGEPLNGMNDATGMLRGVAPGQAGMNPGGAPDIQTLLAGLTAGGQPNLSAGVRRRLPM